MQGDWITAFIGPLVARDRRNWRDALDAVSSARPVVLLGFWGHTTILNSAALERLGITEGVPDPVGGWWGRDDDGRLDGRAYESAEEIGWDQILTIDPAMLSGEIRDIAARDAQWGVTSVNLMNSGIPLDVTLDALAQANAGLKWTVYSWAGPVSQTSDAWAEIQEGVAPEHVRVEGPKWLLDGTGVEQNALQREAYLSRPDWRGRSNLTDSQLQEVLQTALNSPTQLARHVVGDAETTAFLRQWRRSHRPRRGRRSACVSNMATASARTLWLGQ